MKKLVVSILVLLIGACTARAFTKDYCKFYRNSYIENLKPSLRGNFLTYNYNKRTYVVDRKTGVPVIRPVEQTDLGNFDESDSTFACTKIENNIFSLTKYNRSGEFINRYFLNDTFPNGSVLYRIILTHPYSIYYAKNKTDLVCFDLEHNKKMLEFKYPTQEAWDVIEYMDISPSEDLIVVTYPYYYVFYNKSTGDSLYTINKGVTSFCSFSEDGNYYFLTDTNGISVCRTADRSLYYRWENPVFKNKAFWQLKSTHQLLLANGDTLAYLDTNRAFVHSNNRDLNMFQPTYIGDTLYLINKTANGDQVCNFNGEYLYELFNESKVPLKYSNDDSRIINISYMSLSSFLYTKSDNYYYINEAGSGYSARRSFPLAPEKLVVNDLRDYLDVSYGNSLVLQINIAKDYIVDSVRTQVKPYILLGNDKEKYVLVQDTNGKAQTINMARKELGNVFDCPSGIVQLSPDGEYCLAVRGYCPYSCTDDYTSFELYSAQSGTKIFETKGFNNSAIGYGSAAFAPDSRSIAIADSSDTLRIYSTANGALIKSIKLNWQMPTALCYVPGKQKLIYSSANGELGVLDTESGTTRFVFADLYGEPIVKLLLSPNGKYISAITRKLTFGEWEPDWNYTPADECQSVPPANSIGASPNPIQAVTTLTISCAETGKGLLDVFNSLGNRIATISFDKFTPTAEFKLDCSSYAKGAYLLRASIAGRAVAIGKIVVE